MIAERIPYPWAFACAAVTCALAPAYNIRWHVGFYPTTLLELAILLTAAVFVAESVAARSRVDWRTPFTAPALLFVVAGALSVVAAPDRRAALGLYRAYLLEPIAFFLVLGTVLRTAQRARIAVAALLLAGLGVAIPNLVLYGVVLREHIGNIAVSRPVIIYESPNSLPLFLVPLIALAAAIAVYSAQTRARIAAGLFVVVGVLTTVLTFSRGGFLALAAIPIGLALAHRWRLWLAPVAVAAAVVVSRIPGVAERFATAINSDPRVALWRMTLSMLRSHPIFGTGLAGFALVMEKSDPAFKNTFNAEPIYPHNILLNFWAVTGILGLVAFTWVMVQGLIVSGRGWKHALSAWRPIHLGVTLALVSMVVHGLVDVPYFRNDLSLEFWALLGLTWAGTRWGSRGIPSTPSSPSASSPSLSRARDT